MGRDYTAATNNVQTVDYPECMEHVSEIIPFISQFDIHSAAKAIFCINSWHENRSSQQSTYSLNAALLSIAEFGSAEISSFESFSDFFIGVKKRLLVSSCHEDEVIPVMGQTLIPFRGKWRRAIHGCGTTLEYPRLCFADAIIQEAAGAEEFSKLLDYVESMAEELDGGGWLGGDNLPCELRMPSQKYWERVSRWIDGNPAKLLGKTTIQKIDKQTHFLENKCFLLQENRVVPLFCPSMLEDYLSRYMDESAYQINERAIDLTLLEQARRIYDSDDEEGSSVLTFPRFIANGNAILKCPATFLIFDGNSRAVLFYNGDAGVDDTGLNALMQCFKVGTGELRAQDYAVSRGMRRELVLKQPSEIALTVVVYIDNVRLNPRVVEKPSAADYACGAVDLLAILLMANNAGEICCFFELAVKAKGRLLQIYSAISDFFCVWMESDQHIIKGAEDRIADINIYVDFNETDRFFTDFCNRRLADYPRDIEGNWLLGSPFLYCFRENERGFTEITCKSNSRSQGLLKRLPGRGRQYPGYLYLRADEKSAQDVPKATLEQDAELFPIIEDLLMCMANDIGPELGLLISDGMYLELVYAMPGGSLANGLRTVDKTIGVKAQALEADHTLILYSVESDAFYKAVAEAENRSVECRFMAAILSTIPDYEASASQAIATRLAGVERQKKMVDLGRFALPYRWHSGVRRIIIDDVSSAAAIKLTAYAADSKGIKPGCYYGRDANEAIRALQGALVKTFENQLAQFLKYDLLIKLYETLAASSHSFHLNTMRYTAFSCLQTEEEKRVREKIFDEREESRYEMRAAMFSIETLLTIKNTGRGIAQADDIARLLAICGQLLSASDDADMLRFEPRGMGIRIASNSIITMIDDQGLETTSRDITERMLLDQGHKGSEDTEDAKFIDRAKVAFEKDTSIPFECFLDVLDVLANDDSAFPGTCYVSPNVISLGKTDLLDAVSRALVSKYDMAVLEKCMYFLILDSGRLKEISGKKYDYLPFGRMKDRPNRVELKPILQIDNRLVFSPVRIGILRRRWVMGIAERFIPAKEAFPSLNTTLENWKRRYEKSLEKDVQRCFLDNGFNRGHVFKGLELCKRGNHPQRLGDYDGLAYDDSSETIWAIECKEFEKVESAYDYMQLQERWFGKGGKLHKFERRIEYLRDNLDVVVADLGFEHVGQLHLRAYLVCNKLFMNAMGNSSFQVITLSELDMLLGEAKVRSH